MDAKHRGWYATVQMALRSLEAIERRFEAESGLPMSWCEVLFSLHKSPDGRRRMSELAEQSLLSRGGATRLIARMEEAGLVTREIPPEDRRATYAVLTDKGRETLERISPIHTDAVHTYFTPAIDDDEAELLRNIAVRVLELTGERCDWLIRDLTGDQAS